jgi:hypothetical protein
MVLDLSIQQRVILAVSRMVSGSLSVIASSIIVYKVYLRYREHRRNNGIANNQFQVTTYHRLLFGMSLVDVLYSSSAALSTLPVSASTGAVFGHGTTATCAAQGFFVQLGPTIPVYIAALNTYFLLKIRYNVSNEAMCQRYEPWFHAVPLIYGFTSSTIAASLKILNPILVPELGCWIAPYPPDCIEKNETCTRGYKIAEYLDLYVWVLTYSWLFAAFAVVVVDNILIYTSIRQLERGHTFYHGERNQSSATAPASCRDQTQPGFDKEDGSHIQDTSSSNQMPSEVDYDVSEDSFNSSSQRPERRVRASRIAAVQSILYCSTTFFTAMWIFLPWLGNKIDSSNAKSLFIFGVLVNVVAPLQGCFNLYIFVRLQYNRLRLTEPAWSRIKCVQFCLFSPASK